MRGQRGLLGSRLPPQRFDEAGLGVRGMAELLQWLSRRSDGLSWPDSQLQCLLPPGMVHEGVEVQAASVAPGDWRFRRARTAGNGCHVSQQRLPRALYRRRATGTADTPPRERHRVLAISDPTESLQ